MSKCWECNAETTNNYPFCKKCYDSLYSHDAIAKCSNCGEWHYAAFPECICDVSFMQCNKCGRWHNEEDSCICEAEVKCNKAQVYAKKGKALTEAEMLFYNKLKQVINPDKYVINVQTSLRQLVEKTKRWAYANELNRDVDFCIWRASDGEVVLCIEYDDTTHLRPNRQERDRKVDEIAETAGLVLIHIKRDNRMSVDYLRGKLENYIKQ